MLLQMMYVTITKAINRAKLSCAAAPLLLTTVHLTVW
jgi:hypothetical protein